jgi:serine/threonine-protein kinase
VVHEVGETEDGRPFLAMEYVEGKTLDVVMQHRRLKIGEIINLGIEAAEALNAAHARNLVHRDIKPGNIMLDRRNRVKLLDFGLAKRVLQEQLNEATTAAANTKSGVLIGTPFYMSPEQALGREVDGRSDIFSLGVVLYELLAGQKPFLGKTVGETINNVVNQPPEPLGLENPLFSPALDGIIFKCLEKDPEKRYKSANSLAEDLVRLRNDVAQTAHRDKTVEASKPSIMAPLSPTPKATKDRLGHSHRPVVLAGILVFVTLIVVGGSLIHSKNRAGPGRAPAGNPVQQNSVAVLPFDNISNEPESEYLSDGLTEEITTALSRIHGLKVAARNSAFAFKGKKEDARKIGETLRVSTLLEGSIRKDGKKIRITAQLINAADGFHLWSETYDRSADDIIAVQEDIAKRIAQRLQLQITEPSMPSVTANKDAHKLYMQGRQFWNKRTEDGLNNAIKLFKGAIDKDAGYAAAHAGLAASYNLLPMYSSLAKVKDCNPLARASANRALELDPTCAEAHAVLGNLQLAAKEPRLAEEHFRRAIQLDPNYATAHHWYGRFLLVTDHRDQALSEYLTAVDLDPLSPIIHTTIPQWYYMGGEYDRAIEESRKVINAFPDFPAAREGLIASMLMKQQYEQALDEIDKAQALMPQDPIADLPMRGYALARMGKTAEAEKIIKKLEEQRKLGKLIDGKEAFVYLGLREYDKVIDALERMEATEGLDEEFACEPFFAEIQKLPRFQALLKKAGIKQEAASFRNDERLLDGNAPGKTEAISSGPDGRRPG